MRWLVVLLVLGCERDRPVAPPADLAAAMDARSSLDLRAVDLATGDDGGPGCHALGGTCVPGKWANCPPGTQPAGDIHADCTVPSSLGPGGSRGRPPGAVRGYFCCVPAPPSECAQAAAHLDCFPDEKCHPCWGHQSVALSCAGGRTCCAYTCAD